MKRFRVTNAETPFGPWRATRQEAETDLAALAGAFETIDDSAATPPEVYVIEEGEGLLDEE